MLSPMRPRVGVRDVFDEFALVDAYTAEPVDLALLGITPATAAGPTPLAVLVGVYTRGAHRPVDLGPRPTDPAHI